MDASNGPMGSMRCWDFVNGSTTSELRVPANAISASGGVTWVSVVYSTALSANRTVANSNQTTNGGLQFRVNSTGRMALVQAGISVIATDAVITIVAGAWSTIAFSLMNLDPTRSYAFAADGVLGSIGTPTGVTLTSDVGVIGASAANGTPWAGQMALFACFDSVFSQGELCDITQNPWQMFASPANDNIWTLSPASSAAPILLDNSRRRRA